jgi:hypothetical protein
MACSQFRPVQTFLWAGRVQASVGAALMTDSAKAPCSTFLESEGVILRRRPFRGGGVQVAGEVYEKCWSLARIGERFGRRPSVVRKALLMTGLTARGTHGWYQL